MVRRDRRRIRGGIVEVSKGMKRRDLMLTFWKERIIRKLDDDLRNVRFVWARSQFPEKPEKPEKLGKCNLLAGDNLSQEHRNHSTSTL